MPLDTVLGQTWKWYQLQENKYNCFRTVQVRCFAIVLNTKNHCSTFRGT